MTRPVIQCGYELSVDATTYGSKLCGQDAVVRVSMREFGSIYLCEVHYNKATREAIERNKFNVTKLDV